MQWNGRLYMYDSNSEHSERLITFMRGNGDRLNSKKIFIELIGVPRDNKQQLLNYGIKQLPFLAFGEEKRVGATEIISYIKDQYSKCKVSVGKQAGADVDKFMRSEIYARDDNDYGDETDVQIRRRYEKELERRGMKRGANPERYRSRHNNAPKPKHNPNPPLDTETGQYPRGGEDIKQPPAELERKSNIVDILPAPITQDDDMERAFWSNRQTL